MGSKKRKKEKSPLGVIFYLASSFLAFRLVCSYLPEARLWGLNQAAFISGMPLLYVGLFLIAVVIYYRRAAGYSESVGEGIGSSVLQIYKTPYPYIIVIVFVGAFYLFSVRSHFLGDGYQLISYLSQPHPPYLAWGRKYGEMKIHQLLAQQIDSWGQRDVYLSFKYISIASGLVFVISLLYYGRKLTNKASAYYTFIFLNLFSASVILFFGYVELYSAQTAFLFLYFLSALNSLRRGKKSIIPVIMYIIAVFMHTLSLVLFPSFIIYMLLTFGNRLRKILEKKSKMIILAIVVLSFLAYAAIQIGASLRIQKAFLPPLADRFTAGGYTLLSLSHIIDFLNLIMFLIPITLIVSIVLIVRRPQREENGVKAASLFLFSALTIGIMAAFLIDPKLGMARDWDLMSTMLIGAQITGIYLWIDNYARHHYFQPASILLIIACLSAFIPWLAIHKSPEALYSYGFSAMKLDPKRTRGGLISMAERLKAHKKYGDAEEIERFCYDNLREDILIREADKYFDVRNHARAQAYYKKAIGENPGFFLPYLRLAKSQIETNQIQDALENLQISDALNPYNSNVNFYIGVGHKMSGNIDIALNHWKQSIHYDVTNPRPYVALTEYFWESRVIDSSKYYYSVLSDISRVSPEELYPLGLLGLKIGDTERAITFFNRYERDGSDSLILRDIEKIKSELRK